MKIVLTGGSGFVGRELIQRLDAAGHAVTLLTRNPSRRDMSLWNNVRVVQWDALTLGDWVQELDGANAVVNLTGEPLAAKRWTYDQKYRILISRVDATRGLVYAMHHAASTPSVLVNASGSGYYGHVEDGDVTESHKKGSDFLATVCDKWEEAALQAEKYGVRVVLLRFGVVLGDNGGVLQKMAPPFRYFLGAWPGSGKQWLPWVHREDVLSVIQRALENPGLHGPVNVAAPEAVTMKTFCKSLASSLGRPCWTGIPSFVLRRVLGEMSEMLTTGQRLVPAKLLQSGYSFRFPRLRDALSEIFS